MDFTWKNARHRRIKRALVGLVKWIIARVMPSSFVSFENKHTVVSLNIRNFLKYQWDNWYNDITHHQCCRTV